MDISGLDIHPQSWQSCDAALRQYLNGLAELFRAHLDGNFVGVYLHGSLAMGSYFPPKSDMDVIAVAAQSLDAASARALSREIAYYSDKCPTLGNLECSLITRETARNVPAEMPYELHFSTAWYSRILNDEVEYGVHQTDGDLPAHLLTLKRRGLCLKGEPIDAVFGEVRWADFLTAILDDFDWLVEGENICESPFYCVLNICRVLQALTERNEKVLSKYEGALWGLANLPAAHAGVIRRALAVYADKRPLTESQRRTGGVEWDTAALLAFRDYARVQTERSVSEKSV